MENGIDIQAKESEERTPQRNIERGASWTLDETKILLSLWGHDLVKNALNGTKRTKKTYDKISLKFNRFGYERTPDRIYHAKSREEVDAAVELCGNDSDNNQASVHINESDLESNHQQHSHSPPTTPSTLSTAFESENEINAGNSKPQVDNENGKHSQGRKVEDMKEPDNSRSEEDNDKPSFSEFSSGSLTDCGDNTLDIDQSKKKKQTIKTKGSSTKRARVTKPRAVGAAKAKASDVAAQKDFTSWSAKGNSHIQNTNGTSSNTDKTPNDSREQPGSSQQFYSASVNNFDVTSSALLIDRMFSHLRNESENMREWLSLEKERLAQEIALRQQEAERDARRERIMLENFDKMHDRILNVITDVTKVCTKLLKQQATVE
ncbi:hypothetical protein GZH46_01082, partial [Fragariocoptes setiger]